MFDITIINKGDTTLKSEIKSLIPEANFIEYPFKPSTDFKGDTDTFSNFVKTQTQNQNSEIYFFK